jgi:hypothetical protein
MKVFVATIPLYYEVIAVADSKEKAIRLASVAAHKDLVQSGSITEDTDTPRKVAEYFGVKVYAMEMNSTSDDSQAEGLD